MLTDSGPPLASPAGSQAQALRGPAGWLAARVYYGWVMVAVMTVLTAITMAMAGFNFALFIRPMGQDLGISRATFGLAMAARQVASAATSPFTGRLVDRHGSRYLLVVGGVVTCLGLVGLANVQNGWQVVAIFLVMGLAGFVGPGTLATSVPIAKWFVVRRSRAMAVTAVGAPVGGVVFVPLTQVLIREFGWQHTWLIFAVLGAVTILPLSVLFVRRQPEDHGLHPDGLAPAAGLRRATVADLEDNWRTGEALRSVTFWKLVTVFSLVNLAMSSTGIHRIPHFTDQGISPLMVSLGISVDATAATIATFSMGFITARVPPRWCGAVAFLLIALGVYMTILAHSVLMMFLSMIVFGAGAGSLIMMQNFLWADYFGRMHVGSIRGAALPIMMIFSAIGPPLAGLAYDVYDTYNGIWWAGIGFMLVGAVILVSTRPPRRRSQPTAGREAAHGALAPG